MEGRHLIELCLVDAIRNRFNKRAIQLIDMLLDLQPVRETNPPNLNHFDDEHRSFLYHAIEAKNIDIALRLLELQKENEHIIFARETSRGITLFHIAAEFGLTQLIDPLVAAACKFKETHSDYKYWLHPSIPLATPIAHAVLGRHYDTVVKLLSLIKNEENSQLIIDQTDNSGNNLLHFALDEDEGDADKPNGKIVQLLMEHHVSFTHKNEHGESPFDMLCNLSASKQQSIFQCLDKKYQAQVLTYYHARLVFDPTDDGLMSIYYTLARIHSLQAYLIARHEFDETLPLREYYHEYQVEKATRRQIVIRRTKTSILKQNEFAPRHIPRYCARLFKQITANPQLKELPVSSDDDLSYHLSVAINMIENYLPHLHRHQTPSRYRVLSITLPMLVLFFGKCLYDIIAEVARINSRYEYSYYYDFPEYHKQCNVPGYFQDHYCSNVGARPYYLIMFVVACSTLISSCVSACNYSPAIWNKDPTIPQHDWNAILKFLEQTLMINPKIQEAIASDIIVLQQNQTKAVVEKAFQHTLSILKSIQADYISAQTAKLC